MYNFEEQFFVEIKKNIEDYLERHQAIMIRGVIYFPLIRFKQTNVNIF